MSIICEKCGDGFNHKSRTKRHMETCHPTSAPSAADVEKILSGIDFLKSKREIQEYAKRNMPSIMEIKEKEEKKKKDIGREEILDIVDKLKSGIYYTMVDVEQEIGKIL